MAALLVVTFVPTVAVVHAVDRNQLRAAAPLPRMETGFQFNFGNVSQEPQDEAEMRTRISGACRSVSVGSRPAAPSSSQRDPG